MANPGTTRHLAPLPAIPEKVPATSWWADPSVQQSREKFAATVAEEHARMAASTHGRASLSSMVVVGQIS
jgi:hypothetical protein